MSASNIVMLRRRSRPNGRTNKASLSYNNWMTTLDVPSVRGNQRTWERPTCLLVPDTLMAAS